MTNWRRPRRSCPIFRRITVRWPIFSIAWTTARMRLPRPVPRSASIRRMPRPINTSVSDCIRRDNIQAAVHAYVESLARDPDNADTYYDMGIALHADGNLPRAITAYEQAIRLRPAFWEAHSNLGLILHEQGNLRAGRRRIPRGQADRPRRSLHPQQSGQYLLRPGKLRLGD